MSTALYRRYRPDSFSEMIGQEHVTGPLMQALRSNRVNHAYLFSGPRGCGKTTSARILARILNCAQNTEASPTDTPCGQCPSCIELARGGSGSLDVVEIDAASHGGVDDARDLRERATFSPSRDRFKIFILDEAHMVTAQGFNALLKIVEEPPPYLKFIFATTEPDKVIGTIRSRTHHYPFKLVAPETMHAYLVELCKAEGIIAKDGVLPLVVRAGAGSVRDTLSVLDQLIAGSSGGVIEYELAVALLGFTPASLLDEVVESFGRRDGAQLFRVIEQIVGTGHEPRRFVEDLLERLRDLIVISLSGDNAAAVLPGVPADQLARMQGQAGQLGAAELSRSADVVNTALTEMSGATSPRLHLELLCARLLLPAADNSAGGLGARIDGLERALSNGSLGAAPANATVGGSQRAVTAAVSGSHSVSEAPAQAESSGFAAAAPATAVQETVVQEPVAQAVAAPRAMSQTGAGGERKSLRPDSTRRKPVAENKPTVSAQSAPSAPGSMFAQPAATTGIFGTPAQAGQDAQNQAPSDQTRPVAPSDRAEATQTQAVQTPPVQNQPVQNQPVQNQPVQSQPVQPQPVPSQHSEAIAVHSSGVQPQAVRSEPEVPQNVGRYDGPRDEQGRPLAANTGWHTAQSREPQAVHDNTAQQAQQAQQAQPNSGSQTETFKLRWPEVLDAFAATHRATGAFTKQFASVAHLSADTLYISAPNPGLVQNLVSRGAQEGIAQAVQQTLGFQVSVVIDVEGSDRFPKAESSTEPSVAAQAPTESAPTPQQQHQPMGDGHRGADTSHSSAETGWQTHPETPGSPEVDDSGVGSFGAGSDIDSQARTTSHLDTQHSVQATERVEVADQVQQPQGGQELGSRIQPEPPAQPEMQEFSGPSEHPEQPNAEQSHTEQQHQEPAPFDPMASVNIFGAAIGALATARSVANPELPRLGAVAQAAVQEVASRASAPSVPSATESSEIYHEPAPEPPHDWDAEPAAKHHLAPEVPAAPVAQQHETAASPAGTVPPWEETPRQAAQRRAAEHAAREAERQKIVDDPQPDDEDLDASNLVGVPLVMSMFGATIIDEITETY